MSLKLDDRLRACADFIREGKVLCDVGTDHAYLPTFLIKTGKISKALACDINEQPLMSAKATVTENGVFDNVTLRLCNGLDGVFENEFDDLVIAGMGGELIINILEACPYIKNEKYNIVLQPMSKVYDLRKWLTQNGFEITDEQAVRASGKIYTVMNVCYCKSQEKDEFYFHFGSLGKSDEPLAIEYCKKIKNALIKKANGILSADKNDKTALELIKIAEKYKF